MIAVYLAMLETDVDRDKFMKLYESYEKKLFAIVFSNDSTAHIQPSFSIIFTTLW